MANIFLRYPGNKAKCLTFSYDDGNVADVRLVEMFNKHNVKGTFNLNAGSIPEDETGWRLSKKDVEHLYDGHEVATHGFEHPILFSIDLPTMTNQLLQDRLGLEKLFGRVIKGYAYPFGKPAGLDDELYTSMRACGIQYGRTVNSTFNFDLPRDWYNWQPTCHHNHEKLMEYAEQFLKYDAKAQPHNQSPYLFYVWGHSFEFNSKDNWEVMENLLEKVANKEDVWYATNGEIYDYVSAFKSLSFSADQSMVYNPSCQKVFFATKEKDYVINPGETIKL